MRQMLTATALLAGLGFAAPVLGQSADVLLNCSNCHTVAPDPGEPAAGLSPYPDLNGKPVRYLERQLHAYRNGLRQHARMQQTAIMLGAGNAAMARLYADAPVPRLRFQGDPADHATARRLIDAGDWTRGLAPCASCHGAKPESDKTGMRVADQARLVPRLHGQPDAYLARQLRAYADGTRRSDSLGRMRAFSARLTPAEISQLTTYYADWTPISQSPRAAECPIHPFPRAAFFWLASPPPR